MLETIQGGAGIIQAWGDLDDPAQRGRIIIDCLMNLPLLHWASAQSGDGRYREAALSHLRTAGEARVQVRSPVRMSGFEPGPPRPAPRPGEHTDEVLRQAGVGEAELAGLRAKGAVG